MPRQGVPRLACRSRWPAPALGVLPCGSTGRSAAAFPAPSGQGKARRASVRNGKAQDRQERGQCQGRSRPGVCPPLTIPGSSAAPPLSRCVVSKASGRGLLLPFPRPCVAHQLADIRRTSVVRSHGMAAVGSPRRRPCYGYSGQSNRAQIVRAVLSPSIPHSSATARTMSNPWCRVGSIIPWFQGPPLSWTSIRA
jgi:hypothetical protein